MARKRGGGGKRSSKQVSAITKIAKELKSAVTGAAKPKRVKKGRKSGGGGRKAKAFGGGIGSDLIGQLARPSRSEAAAHAILPTATANKFIPGLTGFT